MKNKLAQLIVALIVISVIFCPSLSRTATAQAFAEKDKVAKILPTEERAGPAISNSILTDENESALAYSSNNQGKVHIENTLVAQQSKHAKSQESSMSRVASMQIGVSEASLSTAYSLPAADYDEQIGLTFTQDFSSILYHVTATQQIDDNGYGPAYLLNGVTDMGYWYQVGFSYDWPYSDKNTGWHFNAGWRFNYEVFDNKRNSIYPVGGGGGVDQFNGPVNDGDVVVLNLHFSGGNVVMLAEDQNTGSYVQRTYSAEGGKIFQGQTNYWYATNGFFTGLMTEWYHAVAYYGGEETVSYTGIGDVLSSWWQWAQEKDPTDVGLFLSYDEFYLSNPGQLQYLAYTGGLEAANEYSFITGASSPPSSISCIVNPGSIYVGSGTRISGTISSSASGDLSGNVYLQYKIDDNYWNPIDITTANSAGEYSYWWAPSSTGTFYIRCIWNGNNIFGGDTSTSATLTVNSIPPGNLIDHTMCKGVQTTQPFNPITRTSTFYADDEGAYSWAEVGNIYGAGHTISWEFYDPDGQKVSDYHPWNIPDPGAGNHYTIYGAYCEFPISEEKTFFATRIGRPFQTKVYYDGNLVVTETWTVLKHISSISVSLSSSTIDYGTSLTVSSQLSCSSSDGTTTLQYSTDGINWKNLASGTPSMGYYSSSWTPPDVGNYWVRAIWTGDFYYYDSTSAAQSLTVTLVAYIRADGSVDPSSAPIQRNGNVYSFVIDIKGSIVIQRDNVIIDGTGHTLQGTSEMGIELVGRRNVTIRNIQIEDFRYADILLDHCLNINIFGNNITNNGINEDSSNYTTVSGNNITNNYWGFWSEFSTFNSISRNNITNNYIGIDLYSSPNNIISGNNITGSDYAGTYFDFSSNCTFTENNVANNNRAIMLGTDNGGLPNILYHNNFMHNTQQVGLFGSAPNSLDNGYPSSGNYWSDYADADSLNGPNQNLAGSDGVWDHPYVIDGNNMDHYPLVKPWIPTESLVVRGMDYRIYYRTFNCLDGSWNGWNVLPTGATCDCPAAVQVGNELHIVVRGMDGATLWHEYINRATGTISGWKQIGGATPSAPTLTSNGTSLCLVVRGEDNSIYYCLYSFNSRTWGSWKAIPTGATVDSPSSAMFSENLTIVVRGTDGSSLWQTIIRTTDNVIVKGWTPISGATVSKPVLAYSGLDNCYLVVRGMDDRIYYRSYTGSTGSWGNWSAFPTGATPDGPGATVMGSELCTVVRGMDGSTLWCGDIDLETGSFTGWTLLSGATPSAPTLTS